MCCKAHERDGNKTTDLDVAFCAAYSSGAAGHEEATIPKEVVVVVEHVVVHANQPANSEKRNGGEVHREILAPHCNSENYRLREHGNALVPAEDTWLKLSAKIEATKECYYHNEGCELEKAGRCYLHIQHDSMNYMAKRIVKTSAHLIAATVLLLAIGKAQRPASAVPTNLYPGDLLFLTINTDGTYPGGANANAFDVLTRVDLGAGTEIYFTDKGWDGNIPGWRATTGEGVLRYTVPAGGQLAGSIIRYDDTLIGVSPDWAMFSMDPAGNLGAAGGSSVFDLSGSGDTILAFQGSGTSPTFLAGVGAALTNVWISTGTPSSNNSWVPSGISQGTYTVVSLGNQDNYQFNCTAPLGIFATNLLQQNATAGNWVSNDTVLFGSTSCSVDTTRPTATIQRASGQAAATNVSPITFRLTSSEAVAGLTLADIQVSGPATGTSISPVSSTEYDIIVTPSGEGSISIDLLANGVVDVAENPNLLMSGSGALVVYDTTAPGAPSALTLASGSDTGSSNSDGVTSDDTPTITVNCESGATVTLFGLSSVLGSNPAALCVSGSASFTPTTLPEDTYTLSAGQTDQAGNVSATSGLVTLTVDTTAPSATAGSVTSYSIQPALSGSVNEPTVRIEVTINGNTTPAVRTSLSWSIAAGGIPALPVGAHQVSVETEDLAGNVRTQSAVAVLTVLGDTDGDGIVDEDERAAGGGLDGNGDGTPDWQQAAVATKLHSSLGTSMTLQLVGGTAGCSQIDRYETTLESALSSQDASRSYPVGFASFEATCITPGGSADIEWILDQAYNTANWSLQKYLAASGAYVQIPGAIFETRSIAGTPRTIVRFSIVDGGQFDADGTVNGRIVDPSGPGVSSSTSTAGGATLPKTGQATAVMMLAPGILTLLAVAVARSKRI